MSPSFPHQKYVKLPHKLSQLPRQIFNADTTNRFWDNSPKKKTTSVRHKSNPHKGLIPLTTQNFKIMNLWVFFLIWCLTFSTLDIVRLKVTLRFLSISNQVWVLYIGIPHVLLFTKRETWLWYYFMGLSRKDEKTIPIRHVSNVLYKRLTSF